MDMIERAARALAGLESFGDEDLWQNWIPEVRAVLEAIRGPSEGMIEAVADYRPISADVRAKQCWQAMIDAALNPLQQPTQPPQAP